MKYPEFAKRLAELVKDRKGDLTQAEIARWLGVSQPTINSWLQGEAMPGIAKAVEVCKKLSCCVEYLLTGAGPKDRGAADSDIYQARISKNLSAAKAAMQASGYEFTDEEVQLIYKHMATWRLDADLSTEEIERYVRVFATTK